MRVALVNTNRVKTPVAPIALDYLGEMLHLAGHEVQVLDLCWAEDLDPAIAAFFGATDYGLVGVTLRNSDDCTFGTRRSFVGEFVQIITAIRQHTASPIILGGVGFSVLPEQVLALCPADAGVWSDGEQALVEIANRVESRLDWHEAPNLIWRRDNQWQRNPPSTPPLTDLPPLSRTWVDNLRYLSEGGQVGLETKRGCPNSCIYCVDPVCKGKAMRPRPASAVVDELERLLAQGINYWQSCDSEFNSPEWHALEVCQEIVRRGLGEKVHWDAMCSPLPFSPELAQWMKRAGCAAVNFGADNGDEEMLRRLKRGFGPQDILNAVQACKQVGITVMIDLLLGAPGETKESLVRTMELMRQAGPNKVNAALGLRVYPGTELASLVQQDEWKAGLIGGDDLTEPVFFIAPQVAPFASELIDSYINEAYRRRLEQRRAFERQMLRGLR